MAVMPITDVEGLNQFRKPWERHYGKSCKIKMAKLSQGRKVKRRSRSITAIGPALDNKTFDIVKHRYQGFLI